MELENNFNSKEYFNHLALERINTGKWGLQQIEYLHQHQNDYGLKAEDINLYILHIYRYTYNLAMADGNINREEMVYLQNIKALYNHYNPPQGVAAVIALKQHINAISKNFVHNHVQELNDERLVEKHEQELKEEAEKVYKKPLPKYPRPKLTPYNNFW